MTRVARHGPPHLARHGPPHLARHGPPLRASVTRTDRPGPGCVQPDGAGAGQLAQSPARPAANPKLLEVGGNQRHSVLRSTLVRR